MHLSFVSFKMYPTLLYQCVQTVHFIETTCNSKRLIFILIEFEFKLKFILNRIENVYILPFSLATVYIVSQSTILFIYEFCKRNKTTPILVVLLVELLHCSILNLFSVLFYLPLCPFVIYEGVPATGQFTSLLYVYIVAVLI